MREIRFRIWEKERQTMFFIGDKNGTDHISIYGDGDYKWFAVGSRQYEDTIGAAWTSDSPDNSKIPMQFTGLVDKNGVDIYEGDFVEIRRSGNPHTPDTIHQSEVVWYESKYGFAYAIYSEGRVIGHSWGLEYTSIYHPVCEIEVIGNIYSHPNLLRA